MSITFGYFAGLFAWLPWPSVFEQSLVSELLETDCISDIPEFEIQENLNRLSKADSKRFDGGWWWHCL